MTSEIETNRHVAWVVIDAETNGLPDYKKPADDPAQPRLASLGLILLDAAFATISETEFFVLPDGWTMSPESTAVNGLTDEILRAKGVPIAVVLDAYTSRIREGAAVASFGAQFDCKQLRGELRRANLPDLFEETRNVCLMRACASLKIKKLNGKGGWPGSVDACSHFGIEPEPKPHQAIEGARRAVAILRKLAELKLLPAPEVHKAKPDSPALKRGTVG